MLVPRSFKSTQPKSVHSTSYNEKERDRGLKRQTSDKTIKFRPDRSTESPPRTASLATSNPIGGTRDTIPSRPVTIPSRPTTRSLEPVESTNIAHRSAARRQPPRYPNVHNKDALPPSVAALLAITAIPPPKVTRPRRRPAVDSRRISIDELVQEWRHEAASMPTIGSHKTMETLLEPSDQSGDESIPSADDSVSDETIRNDFFAQSRSTSSESVPSLDLDDRSVLSISNPPTPGDSRARRSSSFGASRKTKSRSLPASEDTSMHHPLVPDNSLELAFDPISLSQPPLRTKEESRRKSSFKSNLTASLQTLKSRALYSLSQLNLQSSSPGPDAIPPYAFTDQTLWQHPFLFPRIGPEIRPALFQGTPTESERRYFNPATLNFDEQQGHFRAALHSPLGLAGDEDDYAPMIQMQTYSRNKPVSKSRRGPKVPTRKTDANSEAGRALMAAGPPLMRQREPRENSDFLRVVVLEMNMRREGKLEDTVPGRARIWLPPRRAPTGGNGSEKSSELLARNVPRRWIGMHAEEL